MDKVDILIKNVNLLDVVSEKIYKASVAIKYGKVFGFEADSARTIINGDGKYLAPGFIDGHVHIESSMLTPSRFAEVIAPRGTTTVVSDPHEIANVLGIYGVKLFMEESKNLPINLYLTVPSCVPATDLETSGARIGCEEIEELMGMDGIIGLGEMMNFPGVINKDQEVLKKISIAKKYGKIVDGHAPKLSGKILDEYISAGIMSDHESTEPDEAMEKLRKGMYLMIREGSVAKNMDSLLGYMIENDIDTNRCMLVSDDIHPYDLLTIGHMDYKIRKAISMGLDPIKAFQMVTLNPAQYFNLNTGRIEVGMNADVVILSSSDDSFSDFVVDTTINNGRIAAKDGKLTEKIPKFVYEDRVVRSVKLKRKLKPEDFEIHSEEEVEVRVIGVKEGDIIGESLTKKLHPINGKLNSDVQQDVLKIAVVERHKKTGNIGKGFVHGFGLKNGTIASTVAHDSHNIVIVGTDDVDMSIAANFLEGIGGIVIVKGGKVLNHLQLEVAGLMTTKNANYVNEKLDRLHVKAKELGCKLKSPFMTMSFLSLPVVPELKLTDRGLVDVKKFEIVPLLIQK